MGFAMRSSKVWLEYHDKSVKNCEEEINEELPGLGRATRDRPASLSRTG